MTRIVNNASNPVTGNELPTQPAVTGDAPPAPAVTRSTVAADQPSLIDAILNLVSLGLGVPQNQDVTLDLHQLMIALDKLEFGNRNRRAEIDGQARSEALKEFSQVLSRGDELRARQDELKALLTDKLRELAGLEAAQAGAEGDDRLELDRLIAAAAAVIVTLKADLDSNGKLLDAASASAAGFLLDLLQSALSGSDLDTARSELFDTMSQIGLDTILEVLKRFDLPDEGKWVDDEENRKMLEKLIGSLAVIEETIRQLRALAELPPPQTVKSSVEDEAVRRRNRLQLSLS